MYVSDMKYVKTYDEEELFVTEWIIPHQEPRALWVLQTRHEVAK